VPAAELRLAKDIRVNLEQATVLLFEAPKPSSEILVQMLYSYGVRQPIRRHTVDDALGLMQADATIDLVVCDAGGHAYEFVRALRANVPAPNRYCPVILLSGHTPLSEVAAARDCGANFVVAKPLYPLVLLERILWVCADRRLFVDLPSYAGPDRRFQYMGPPRGAAGRRAGDNEAVSRGAGPNLTQAEIDRIMRTPSRIAS
jgi:CheY-like chemotaxis protein